MDEPTADALWSILAFIAAWGVKSFYVYLRARGVVAQGKIDIDRARADADTKQIELDKQLVTLTSNAIAAYEKNNVVTTQVYEGLKTLTSHLTSFESGVVTKLDSIVTGLGELTKLTSGDLVIIFKDCDGNEVGKAQANSQNGEFHVTLTGITIK